MRHSTCCGAPGPPCHGCPDAPRDRDLREPSEAEKPSEWSYGNGRPVGYAQPVVEYGRYFDDEERD